jgi:hypothetical protein
MLVGSLVAQIEERSPELREPDADARKHPAARLAAALARVSAKLARGERMVVLIDGLDEYDAPARAQIRDANVLCRNGGASRQVGEGTLGIYASFQGGLGQERSSAFGGADDFRFKIAGYLPTTKRIFLQLHLLARAG